MDAVEDYKAVCSRCGAMFKEAPDGVLGHSERTTRSFKGYKVRKKRLGRASV